MLTIEVAGQSSKTPKPCLDNADSRYNREKVMSELAAMLDSSIPEYKKVIPAGFYVIANRPGSFFVYDLTDPSNNKKNLWDCVALVDGHVYHVSPFEEMYSFSHIVILESGALKVFRSINCRDRGGDSLETVLTYLNKKLDSTKDKIEILERVKQYRTYGVYSTVDDPELRCNDVNKP